MSWRAGGVLPHRSLVVLAGNLPAGESGARALADSLTELGIESTYLGREESPQRIAAAVEAERADAVELCLAGSGGVSLLRGLLRELAEIGRRDVRVVLHRVP